MSNSGKRYLIFKMQGALYALDLADVAEVSEPQPTWPIPVAPPYYQGAMNFHGSIVAVMDLAAFMELGESGTLEKLIVLDSRLAALAFHIDQIVRIVPENEAEQMVIKDEGFLCGSFHLPDGKVALLDPARVATRAGDTINR